MLRREYRSNRSGGAGESDDESRRQGDDALASRLGLGLARDSNPALGMTFTRARHFAPHPLQVMSGTLNIARSSVVQPRCRFL